MDGKTYGPDYVVLAGKKWATANIGASDETAYGHYFSWGNNVGYVLSNSKWVIAEGYSGAGTELVGGFTIENYNGTPGHELSGNIPADTGCDAAHANWGRSWRLPTEEEFRDLAAQCYLQWGVKHIDLVAGQDPSSRTEGNDFEKGKTRSRPKRICFENVYACC